MVALVRSKPQIEVEKPVPVVPLVRVVAVHSQDVPLTVEAQGEVLPPAETILAAQVAAQVAALSPAFEVGGFFERHEVLVTLDARDFELSIERAKARVAQARVDLAQQEAQARVARAEWRQLGQGEADPLVLREPQIAGAKAALAGAEAELGKARLDLERTRIRAPFRGRLRRKDVGLGQFLTPGQRVASVHPIDYVEVRLPIPHHELAFLDLDLAYRNGDTPRSGPGARLSALFAGRQHSWEGRIVRTEGELDSRTRMIHLVARVDDPYGRGGEPGRPPLAVGLFVQAEIEGRTIADGILLPRSALRGDDQVLVVDGERLRFRGIDVVRVAGESVLLGGGLDSGELVCVSPLDVVVDGMRVRTTEVEGIQPPAAAGSDAVVSPAPVSLPPSGEPPVPDAPPAARLLPVTARLLSVNVESAGADTVIEIFLDGEFTHSHFRLREPERVALDLRSVVKTTQRSTIALGQGPVELIRIGQFQLEPEPVSRIVFDLRRVSPPEIERTPSGLKLRFPAP